MMRIRQRRVQRERAFGSRQRLRSELGAGPDAVNRRDRIAVCQSAVGKGVVGIERHRLFKALEGCPQVPAVSPRPVINGPYPTLPGVDGLLHVSEMANYRVANVRDELKEGEQIEVKVINIDPSGKVRLSRKVLLKEGEGTSPKYPGAGEAHASSNPGGGDDRRGGDRDRGPHPYRFVHGSTGIAPHFRSRTRGHPHSPNEPSPVRLHCHGLTRARPPASWPMQIGRRVDSP